MLTSSCTPERLELVSQIQGPERHCDSPKTHERVETVPLAADQVKVAPAYGNARLASQCHSGRREFHPGSGRQVAVEIQAVVVLKQSVHVEVVEDVDVQVIRGGVAHSTVLSMLGSSDRCVPVTSGVTPARPAQDRACNGLDRLSSEQLRLSGETAVSGVVDEQASLERLPTLNDRSCDYRKPRAERTASAHLWMLRCVLQFGQSEHLSLALTCCQIEEISKEDHVYHWRTHQPLHPRSGLCLAFRREALAELFHCIRSLMLLQRYGALRRPAERRQLELGLPADGLVGVAFPTGSVVTRARSAPQSVKVWPWPFQPLPRR